MKPPFVVPNVRIEAPQRKRRASTAGGSGFARHLSEASGELAPPPVTETSETLPLDTLLALQAVGDETGDGARHASQQRGETLLDLLDRLRADLLTGRIAGDRLVELAGLVRARRATSGDPRLEQIIDDIELRAEVELAKLTRGR